MLNTGINLNTTNESILHYLALVFTYFHSYFTRDAPDI
jgi:hypothetical protein